jgi:hypothetical protein
MPAAAPASPAAQPAEANANVIDDRSYRASTTSPDARSAVPAASVARTA